MNAREGKGGRGRVENERTAIRSLLYNPHVHSARFGDVIFLAVQPEGHSVSLLLRDVYCTCEKLSQSSDQSKEVKSLGTGTEIEEKKENRLTIVRPKLETTRPARPSPDKLLTGIQLQSLSFSFTTPIKPQTQIQRCHYVQQSLIRESFFFDTE